MTKVEVRLTNFNRSIYEGDDIEIARYIAKQSGYECTLTVRTKDMTAVYECSPIKGFRQISLDENIRIV
jgi:hypothetical protein